MDEIVPHSSWRDGNFATGRETVSGPPPTPEPAGFSISVGDIIYALLRHKWLIIFCSLLGLGGAVLIYRTTPLMYASEARVLVKLVAQDESIGPSDPTGAQLRELPLSDAVINTEMGILTSADLARKVAEKVGPEKILAKLGGGDNLDGATMAITGGLQPYVPARSTYISVIFQHPDRSLVQPILSNLVAEYTREHYEIRRALANSEEFEREKSSREQNVRDLEEKLRTLRESTYVFSSEDSKKAAADEALSTAKALRNTQMELRSAEAMLHRFQGNQEMPASDDAAFLKIRSKYAELATELQRQRAKQALYLSQNYTADSGMVRPFQLKILDLEEQAKKLEDEFPVLRGISVTSTNSFDPVVQKRRVEMLNIELEVLTNKLAQAHEEQSHIFRVGDDVSNLDAQLQSEKKKLTFLTERLDRAKWDASFRSSRDSNIKVVQTPNVPILQLGSLYKKMAMAAAAGVGLGIALALFIELFLDQRVKRPEEVRRLISAPLYLSIPKGAQRRRQLKEAPAPGAVVKAGEAAVVVRQPAGSGTSDSLQPYFDALRDRVLARFDNVARKPKLVGVCGCVGGSPGVTRLAAGLAGALSEAGDLRILLVDMKSCNGKPHPILGRRKSCTLQEVLEHEKREEAQVAPNLYLASAEGGDSQEIAKSSPKFVRSLPQMAASDYDFIIFDMPEVEQISVTPRLARHMDLMLLVVEAEKNHRNVVKEAGALLSEFTPNVAVVLNNTKAALPTSLRTAV